jgi:hypothetical protein
VLPEVRVLFGPVRAVRALELGLDSALVALMSSETHLVGVRPPAFRALVSFHTTWATGNAVSFQFIYIRRVNYSLAPNNEMLQAFIRPSQMKSYPQKIHNTKLSINMRSNGKGRRIQVVK